MSAVDGDDRSNGVSHAAPVEPLKREPEQRTLPGEREVSFGGLRIGLVGPQAPPAGGMANQTRQLAELLRGAQAQVRFAATNPPYRPGWIARVPVLRALSRLPGYLVALWRLAGASDLLHVMANSGWSWHLFATPAVWIGWLRGTPVLVNYHGGEAEQFMRRSARGVRWTMRRAACLAVPSAFLQQVFARFALASEIVPNIVDLQRFHPRQPGQPRGGCLAHLVVTRNLEPIYDVATALRAFALIRRAVPDATLTIGGTGPEADSLRVLCQELQLGSSVRFAGRLDRDQIAELYRQADLSLNPSLADNMPGSVLESLASGVPVVSTNVGGIPYLVEHGVTALLVAPGNPQAMADAAIRVLADATLWQRMSAAGILEARRYTWSNVAPVLSALYQTALGRQDRRGAARAQPSVR